MQWSSGTEELFCAGIEHTELIACCKSRTLAALRSVAVSQVISRLVSCVLCMAGDLWSRIDRLLFGRLSSRNVSVLFAACTDRPNSRAAVTNNLVTVEL